MKHASATIASATGLHARPAAVFVNAAKTFSADVRVSNGVKRVNGKSLISLLTLKATYGTEVEISADGPDEEAALNTLVDLVASGLGDESGSASGAPTAEAAQTNGTHEPKPVVVEPTGCAQFWSGQAASAGIAVGPVVCLQPIAAVAHVTTAAATVEAEHARFHNAVQAARAELEALRGSVKKRLGEAEAAIFGAHLEVLDDPELTAATRSSIAIGQGAVAAWRGVFEAQAAAMSEGGDHPLATRAADIRDVGSRVLSHLTGGGESRLAGLIAAQPEPVIVIAQDLSPSETAGLDPERVLAICTVGGGPNAHTAILARALGLPAIVGAQAGVLSIADGALAILDGGQGTLAVGPDDTRLTTARQAVAQQRAKREAERQAAFAPAVTRDGTRIHVAANIGSLKDAQRAAEAGAEGVGLLRTEFLFLERTEAPTEDEQFALYRDIARAMSGAPVVIRTLDVGGDKPLPYLPLPHEDNPFLGVRGLRLSLARPDLFRTQLRAVYRAAEHGPLHLMFPMVLGVEDWRAARDMAEAVRAELNAPAIPLGIMVEIPSAALVAEQLAREVDFFSIGTNDLTQYTLAIERTHPTLSAQADGLHPAVLALIGRTARAARAAGKWAGVCGELASDAQAAPLLVGLGITELSVSVAAIPATKARVRSFSHADAAALAAQALSCATAVEVRALAWHSEEASGVGPQASGARADRGSVS